MADVLTNVLLDAAHQCTYVRSACRRPRMPKYTVSLLRKKKRTWTFFKNSGDISSYLTARRTAQVAIRQYRRNCEVKLVYSNNRKAFFAYINRNIKSEPSNIAISVHGIVLSDEEAAGVLLTEFSHNFSAVSNESLSDSMSDFNASQLYFNCNEQMVADAMHNYSNSNSSPDGISFCLLKRISRHVVKPLNIVCQQSFNAGVFPSRWKHTVIVPLYRPKGKGDRSFSSSYRPISLCSCLGKIMEKLDHSQLFAYMKTNDLLLPEQQGFMPGRSILSNLLSCDVVIADLVAGGHCYDIISFDFLKAFDKAPHSHVIRELAALGIGGKTLGWFASFLSNRTQQVQVATSLSIKCGVISGTIQGSVLGLILYTVLNNSLLRTIKKNPKMGFADDFKMIADVTANSKAEVPLEFDSIAKWAKDHDMPLSIGKSSVMHCGKKQPYHEYALGQVIIKSVDSMMDLGMLRTSDASYSNHCQAFAGKVSRTAGAIRHAF